MIVSWNWLTDYVLLDMPVEQLTDRLALSGLNHEWTNEVNGDLAIDLEVTSNRADCLAHLGVAREVGVLFRRGVRFPDPNPPTSGSDVSELTRVTVEDPALCPRFTARVITGVKIGPSPWWLRRRLETLGGRSVNNVVDVTNYVMYECGQPLHAYDLAKLKGREIIVRRARPGEALIAINGKSYPLTTSMLAIADAERPVGLGGVMGGQDTEVGDDTRDILIEAAQFNPVSIRGTSRALGLFSPSSFRFERGLDPEMTEWASRRCCELILQVAGGRLHPGVLDVAAARGSRHPISLRFAQIPRVLGIDVAPDRVQEILSALGLEVVARSTDRIEVVPPSWRRDLEREIDLIEEVARVHGYEHIPEDRAVPLAGSARGLRERVEDAVRDALTGLGLDEAYTFSLVGEELIASLEPSADPPPAPLRVEHNSRKRENILRVSLSPSLLAARRHNQTHGTPDAALFEIANVFLPRAQGQGELPQEPTRLALVRGGDYRAVKGIVETLLRRLHIKELLEVRPLTLPFFSAGRAAEILLGGRRLGVLGEVSGEARRVLELADECSVAELDFEVLMAHSDLVPRYQPLPQYPAVARELSLVLPLSVTWADLSEATRSAGGPLLQSIDYLDTFCGKSLPPECQSVHFGLIFRHPQRTLTGEEVDAAVQSVVRSCETRFSASLRM